MHGAITRKNGLPDQEVDMYCDYAATTPLRPEVKDYIISILDDYGNPSSLYSLGDKTWDIIESARNNVRKFINAPDDAKIVFTSSGSASNMLAVRGYMENEHVSVFYSPLLHKSLDLFFKENKLPLCKSNVLKIDCSTGRIDTNDLDSRLDPIDNDPLFSLSNKKLFVVIEYANSEIGTIQPVKEIIDIVHRHGGIVYVDCTGAISSIPIDVQDLGTDMIGFSAHKLGALKGCGVLCIQNNVEINPLIYGAQEYGLMGGTENVLGIAALGKAVEHYEYQTLSIEARRSAYAYIKSCGWELIGDEENRLPNNFYFCIPEINASNLVTDLDIHRNIQVSNGSACNSGEEIPSSALVAIRYPLSRMFSCIRVTFSGKETASNVISVFDAIEDEVQYELSNVSS